MNTIFFRRRQFSTKCKFAREAANMKFSALLFCAVHCLAAVFLGSTQGYVRPYPADCTKYQQCDVSGCFVLSCDRGTEFNPAIETCDNPLRDRAGCQNRSYHGEQSLGSLRPKSPR